jgi:TPP-dependent pyruvate/acetoin dehydrogenase alpha subunit
MSDTGNAPEPIPSGGLSPALLLELHAGLDRLDQAVRILGDSTPAAGTDVPSLSGPAGPVGMAAALSLRRAADGTGDWLAHAPGAEGALFVMGVSSQEFVRHAEAAWAHAAEGRRSGLPWTCPLRGFTGSTASPGTLVEVMGGIALAFLMRREPRVGMVLLDAGALTTGAWHEGLNLAAVRRCPMVVVIFRDDRQGERSGFPGGEAMAAAYGVGWDSVAALDLPGVTAAALGCVRAARNGEGVQLLEVRMPRREDWPSGERLRSGVAAAAGITPGESTDLDPSGGHAQ